MLNISIVILSIARNVSCQVILRTKKLVIDLQNVGLLLGLKKNPVFRATRLTLDFFYENTVFFVGVFIIEVSILKNKRAQRALDRSPETKDFKFPFFIALSTTGDTWQSKS